MNSGEDWSAQTAELAEKAIGYKFHNRALLKTCFTHASYTNVSGEPSNERLEFLGDAVLELAVTEKLYLGSAADEGKLTELRKQYVSQNALSRAEERAHLMQFLRYSGGESNVKGKTASNLFEAVVAGIYLDGGMDAAKSFLTRFLTVTETQNYKTLLQELVQERTKNTPVYEAVNEGGRYVCRVRALGEEASGTGESKKAAETEAAKSLFLRLKRKKEEENK